jgi:hypothetical protein
MRGRHVPAFSAGVKLAAIATVPAVVVARRSLAAARSTALCAIAST